MSKSTKMVDPIKIVHRTMFKKVPLYFKDALCGMSLYFGHNEKLLTFKIKALGQK